MHILGAGRAAFLEFLRNLTPTVLIGSIALVLWARLDFTRFLWSNWASTLAFYVCTLTAAMSFFANVAAFLDHAMGPSFGFERAIRRLRLRGHGNRRLLWALVLLTWRGKPIFFLELTVAMLVVYAALFVGVSAAVSGATTALRNGIR
jgi:glucan phosphoethanolaminetransferase (alkaline phosphatase superfamily)